MAVLLWPNVFDESAKEPMAVLPMPMSVLFMSASSPRTVFSLVKQPSWQTARIWGDNAKQASTSGMRNKPRRKGERFIRFLNWRVVVFILLLFRKKRLLVQSKRRVVDSEPLLDYGRRFY